MTDTGLLATSATDRRQSTSASPVPPSLPHHHHLSLADGLPEEDDGIISCICAFAGDDGDTIQCDNCMRWQHIRCYYHEVPVPDEDQKHYCIDCHPRTDLDARKATERQRKALEQRNALNGLKKPPAKSHKKKTKDSPSLTAQVNGFSSDRHNHIHNHERKSASPRDLPPPAKRPKTSHRSSGSVSQGRKRAGTVTNQRSPSKSPPAYAADTVIPPYSDEFIQLFNNPEPPQVETDTNLMDNIAVTNTLSQWLVDTDAVSKVTGGQAPAEIFKRWDGDIEEIPGRPEVDLQIMEDHRFAQDGIVPKWCQLHVQNEIATGTFIGELRGRILRRDDYVNESENRWNELRHPEPFVFFHPQLPIVIDARQEGSQFRYVRRSCQPNAELQTIITQGTSYHFCFMSTREIMAGEEVTVAWQVPESVRERINSSLSQNTTFESEVKGYIRNWVSRALANCGPCACNGQSNCLMAHYDRRGQVLQPELFDSSSLAAPHRKTKRKQRLPQLDTQPSRSRSVSEARRLDHEEDGVGTDSRSFSGSGRGSASRDITPSTHYSSNTAPGVLPELSEREKKKLMREEEIFKRQELEVGKQKKKRTSGGSNLNTPNTATSKHPSLSSSMKYVDASTSSLRSQPSSTRTATGKRKLPKTTRKEAGNTHKAQRPSYVDASIQCDMDEAATPAPERPRRRYISVTQRLLRRCLSRTTLNGNAGGDTAEESHKDSEMELEPNALPAVNSSSPRDNDATRSSPAQNSLPASSSQGKVEEDVVMAETENEQGVKVESPVTTQKLPAPAPEAKSSESEGPSISSHPPMDPPAPPWPDKEHGKAPEPLEPQADSSEDAAEELAVSKPGLVDARPTPAEPEETTEEEDKQLEDEDAEEAYEPPPATSDPPPPPESPEAHTSKHNNKPDLHVPMPPPSFQFSAPQVPTMSSQNSSSSMVQSPSALTPSLSTSQPLFSPSVTAAVAPSPVRKKLSLSDYTKRQSKARESTGDATGSNGPGGSESEKAKDAIGAEGKDDAIPNGSAIADDKTPDPTVATKDVAKDAGAAVGSDDAVPS